MTRLDEIRAQCEGNTSSLWYIRDLRWLLEQLAEAKPLRWEVRYNGKVVARFSREGERDIYAVDRVGDGAELADREEE